MRQEEISPKDIMNGAAQYLRKNFVKGLGLIGVLAGLGYYSTCTKYIEPNEFGVRQVDVSPLGLFGNQGIQTNIVDTGIRTEVPFFMKIHTFPKDIQVLTLTKKEKDPLEEKYVRVQPAAHIQTSDGFFIDLDVSILYRITNPHKLITSVGGGKLFEDNGIIPKAEPVLKETLGKLTPEDFYDSFKRVPKQEEARDALNNILSDKGIKVEHVLVRYPEYHPQVQERIEGRKLQDQLVYKNQSEETRSAAEAELKKTTEEGQAAMKVSLQKGQAYVTRKQADMSLYDRKKRAEADQLVKVAEATKTELINKSYEGQGSERIVGLEMAKVLSGLETVIIPSGGHSGFNPLNLEQVLHSFQVSTNAGGIK